MTHLILSIYFLLATRDVRHVFFIPIIGIGIIFLEIIITSLLKFRYQNSFILLFVYSVCIISSIWFLELYRINYLITAENQQASVEIFSVIYYAALPSDNRFFLYKKYLWSQIQIQGYVVLMVLLKGLCEKKGQKLDIIVKTWASALDTLDFIDLLSHQQLYSDRVFVYITLSVWSISCFQYVADVSIIKNILLKHNYQRLASIMTYSLLSVIIMDVPHLIVRLYAIIGVRQHDYTSYFLVFKNIFIIILQIADIWTVFSKTPMKKKKTKPTSV
ncbi:unnamed protein product [Rotaria sp. Silwood2]|nr:unnamed protein product [Rotaria sp. Silwood2]CAF3171974.1 unnamed protein product [Rotaria sp. Silwood2]CAF4597833.1 unnamed protein product [Rotaria sp. Silwood2]